MVMNSANEEFITRELGVHGWKRWQYFRQHLFRQMG